MIERDGAVDAPADGAGRAPLGAPRVRFRVVGGDEVDVGPGGVIGRLATAALCVDDPRVSEAHAMVSLRGGELYLLPLRGSLSTGGQTTPQVRLKQGLTVELVTGIALQVVGLSLPAALIVVQGVDGDTVPLLHSVYSLRAGAPPRLVPRFEADAAGWIWATGARYRYRLADGEAALVEPGVAITCGAAKILPCLSPLGAVGCPPTVRPPARAVTLRARYETVHLHAEDDASLVVSGIAARMICELAQFGVPVPWHLVATAIWPETEDLHALRRSWDRSMARLRAKLVAAGLREDLVRPDGCGNVELYLLPGDRVLDEM